MPSLQKNISLVWTFIREIVNANVLRRFSDAHCSGWTLQDVVEDSNNIHQVSNLTAVILKLIQYWELFLKNQIL